MLHILFVIFFIIRILVLQIKLQNYLWQPHLADRGYTLGDILYNRVNINDPYVILLRKKIYKGYLYLLFTAIVVWLIQFFRYVVFK